MAVNIGDNVTAAQFNGLQSRVEQLLGTGADDYGYGQTVTSAAVAATVDLITAAQMDALRVDMNKAWVHQTGAAIDLRNIAAGDIIGADATGTSVTFVSGETYSIDAPVTNGGFNDYLSKMDTLETNRFLIDPGQDTIADITTSSRTTTWNGTINTIFRCTFTSANHRRHFFNSGGQIRLTSTGANAVGSKDNDWLAMITNPGTILFGYNYVQVTGSTAGVTLTQIGNFQLTTAFQQIFRKTGNAAVYAENDYIINAKEVDSATIEFEIRFQDDDTGDQQPNSDTVAGGDDGQDPAGPAVDEDVTLDITVTLATRRASGSYVSVNNPSVSLTDVL